MTKTFGPYSPIRRAGDFYYISGQVGVDPIAGTCGSTTAAQTKQALENLRQLLAKEGLGLGHVIKTTIYLTDMGDFGKVNSIYSEYFAPHKPARSTVAVRELPRVGGKVPIKVEIEAITYKEGTS